MKIPEENQSYLPSFETDRKLKMRFISADKRQNA